MTRPRRINLSFSLYHVLSRSNTGDMAFVDYVDERKFLYYLAKYVKLFSFRLHAYCLMPTHFHLLLESGERPALSEFMRRLLTAYTMYFNKRNERHGHLFQGRFKSYVVDKPAYLLALSRYIHLNPPHPETCKGSSLRYYIKGGEPPFLFTGEILSWFKGDRKKYIEFVREGIGENNKPEILKQRYIGGEAFSKRMSKRLSQMNMSPSRVTKSIIQGELQQEELDRKKAEALLKTVSDFYQVSPMIIRKAKSGKGQHGKAREALVFLLNELLPWNYSRIIEYLGLREKSTVSYHLRKIKQDPETRKTLGKLVESATRKLHKL
ncbi:transposase [Candidatus Sumerlaeota bacterium]|nr:transposase [Candidatus Sumerlaeota bacterium]